MKFENKIWVVIKDNTWGKKCWYADKVGTIQRVTDELFPPDFTVVSKNQKTYPQIKFQDAEIITPSLVQLFLKFIGAKKTTFKL